MGKSEDARPSLGEKAVGIDRLRRELEPSVHLRRGGDQSQLDKIVEVAEKDRAVEARALLQLRPTPGSPGQAYEQPTDHEEVGVVHHPDPAPRLNRDRNTDSSREISPTSWFRDDWWRAIQRRATR